MRTRVNALIAATNAFDVEAVLKLFAPQAVIDDPSTGECFERHAGIRDYVERYFIGYHTATQLISADGVGVRKLRARVDFTGDFGHEIGRLDITFDEEGMILRIHANLE